MSIKYKENIYGNKVCITFDSYEEDGYGGGNTCFYSVPGNCKMTFIESVNGLYAGTPKQMKAKINLVLSKMEIIVSLNTNQPALAKFLKENYELYAYNEVPVGYGTGVHMYQYHIIIRNTLSEKQNKHFLRPIENPIRSIAFKKNLKNKIVAFLKKRRRKVDIALELAQIIQDNTEG